MSKRFIKWIVICIGGMYCQNATSQDIQFKNIGVKEGLDAAEIYNPVFDRNGFVWMASSNGIYFFDGVNVKHYSQEKYPDMPADGIGNIFFDPKDRLWIKSLNATAFIDEKANFNRIPDSENFKTFGFIYQKHLGILIGFEKGLLLYNEKSKQCEEISELKYLFEEFELNYLWRIDEEKFFIRRSDNSFFLIITHPTKTFGIQQIKIDNVTAVEKYGDNSIFLLTNQGKSLYAYSHKSKSLSEIENFAKNTSLLKESVRAIKYHDDNFYAAGSENTLFVFSESGQLLKKQKPDSRELNGLPLGRAKYLEIDSGGTMVVIHNKGISITNLNRNFLNKKSSFLLGSKYFDPYVSGISSNEGGDLFINTVDGLIKWTPQTNTFLHFENTKLEGEFITGNSLNYKDKIFVTDFSNNIKVFDLNGKLLRNLNFPNVPTIRNICIWRENIGFLGTEDGIYIINLDDYTIISRRSFPNIDEIKGRVNDIAFDQDWLLIATSYGVGFAKYNLNTFELRLYSEEKGMLSNRTYSVSKDFNGNIYVASRLGINILHTDGRISSITKKNGLKYDRVENLLTDRIGNIWITNNSLIFKFNPANESISSFEQFLIGDPFSFNIGSKTIIGDSIIAFGGNEGVVYFPYNQLMDDNVPLKSAVLLGAPHAQASLITQDFTLHLPYDKSLLSLTMIVKDMMINDKCFYRYRIGETWSMSLKNRDLLVDLKPGTYQFEFEFSLDERNWKKSPVSFISNSGSPLLVHQLVFSSLYFVGGRLSLLCVSLQGQ